MPCAFTSASASVESSPPEIIAIAFLCLVIWSPPALAHEALPGGAVLVGAEVLVPRRLAPHRHVDGDPGVRRDDEQHRAVLEPPHGLRRLDDRERTEPARRVDRLGG